MKTFGIGLLFGALIVFSWTIFGHFNFDLFTGIIFGMLGTLFVGGLVFLIYDFFDLETPKKKRIPYATAVEEDDNDPANWWRHGRRPPWEANND